MGVGMSARELAGTALWARDRLYQKRWGSCVMALGLWLCLGGRLRIERSKSWRWWPHMVLIADAERWSFHPDDEDRVYGWRAALHPIFRGRWHRTPL